jgi:hypothetical protein
MTSRFVLVGPADPQQPVAIRDVELLLASRCSVRYGQRDLRTIVAPEAVIESVRELLLCLGTEVEVRAHNPTSGGEAPSQCLGEYRRGYC